ncbi:MAG: hypothetical protein IKY81_02655 [Methanocorpusculum sp.]|nr:hypothetical protein [Methanocorpusculum sp.]
MKTDGGVVPVTVSGKTVGISGLKAACSAVQEAGLSGNAAADELLARVKKHNYIPPAAESAYREALSDYYQKNCQKKSGFFAKMKQTFASGDCCCGVRIVEKKE